MHVRHAGVPRPPAVDVCEVAYDNVGWEAYLRNLATEAPTYLRMFGRRLCAQAGADLEVYRRAVERDPFAAVEVLVDAGGLHVDFAEHVARLAEQGVRAQVLHGGMWKTPGGNVNDRLAELVSGHSPLLFFAGVSLRDPADAEREAVRAHRELGARGLSLIPFMDQVDVLAADHDPLFGYAQRHRLPIWVHCGNHFAADRPLDACSWWHIDRLAARYPDLVVIAGHGGWPWMAEMAAVAQRHRRVYLDSSTHRPSAMAKAGYGWEPVIARAQGTLRSKLVFGSTTWATGVAPGALADEVLLLGLGEETTAAWLAGNAAAMLRIDPDAQ